MGPMLVVIMSFAGIFFGREAVEGKIFGQIKGLIGNDAAMQVQNIIASIRHTRESVTGAIIGIIILIIGASGVFA